MRNNYLKSIFKIGKITKYVLYTCLIGIIIIPGFLTINAQTTTATNPALLSCIPDPIDNGLNCTNASDMVEKGLIIPIMGIIRRAAVGRVLWKYDEKTGTYSMEQVESGAVNVMASYMGDVYRNQPTSFIAYVKKKSDEVNPVKSVEAQIATSGGSALGPVYQLWEVIRNLTYVVFTGYFVIIAFMILFRQKLGGQEYVSIVNSIPKVILSLILVTFSLPLAGLMIDIGNICNSLIVSLFTGLMPGIGEILRQLNTVPGTVVNGSVLESQNIITLLNGFLTESFTGGGAIGNNLYNSMQFVIQSLSSFQVPGTNPQVGQILQGQQANQPQGAAGGITVLGTALLSFLFSLTFLQAIFKIFFGLIINYVELILKIIFSPIQLIGSVFNGVKSLTSWMRSVLSNVLVFPAVFLGLVLIAIFTYTGGKVTNDPTSCATGSSCYVWSGGAAGSLIVDEANGKKSQVSFIPAPLGYFRATFNNKLTPLSVNGFISLGLLLFLPEIIDVTKRSVSSGSLTGLSGDALKNNIGKFASKIPLVGGMFK